MIEHNLSYDTHGKKAEFLSNGLTLNDITESPIGECFVKAHVRIGLLPQMLEELLAARKFVKGLMKVCGPLH
jgi:DNA polymerase delta subunit 1